MYQYTRRRTGGTGMGGLPPPIDEVQSGPSQVGEGFPPPNRNGSTVSTPLTFTLTRPATGDGGKPPPSNVTVSTAPVKRFTWYPSAVPRFDLHEFESGIGG